MSLLFIADFLEFQFTDILDVILVAVLLYQLYRLMRGTVAINIFLGIVTIYFIWKLVNALQMDLLSEILGQFVSVGVIALIIVFQREIRQFLLLIGTPRFLTRKQKWLAFWKGNVQKTGYLQIEPILDACKEMSVTNTGALIIITRNDDLFEFVNTGELIDAKISEQLIENIFYKNSPLHDGAIIITGNRIKAARCVLPITRNENFPTTYGLRHRAAVGITENTDAIAITVSEQTGDMAYAKNGTLYTKIKPDAMKVFLELEFS
ncbi:MAG: diadenylate cyclase CdaA [Bacteroidota bacterium]